MNDSCTVVDDITWLTNIYQLLSNTLPANIPIFKNTCIMTPTCDFSRCLQTNFDEITSWLEPLRDHVNGDQT